MPSKPVKGFIWPRDPRPGHLGQSRGKNRWALLIDCFTGKGPDIFVGRIDTYRPYKSQWSGWGDFLYAEDDGIVNPPGVFNGHREDKLYDFQTRRYARWHPGMWSDVDYCQNEFHRYPRYHVDAIGRRFETYPVGHLEADDNVDCWRY